MTLRAPFPWFGGKSRVAHLVWERFGDVPNYVEPFAGSLAVLLARPHDPRTETANDLDCYVSNFWRAVQADPVEVACWAAWPVNEADLHARHRWLVGRSEWREAMLADPLFYDARIAGWWAWGICQWIGYGWCSRPEWRGRAAVTGTMAARGESAGGVRQRGEGHQPEQLPHLGDAGRGINRKLPHLGDAGRGVLIWILQLAERLRRVRIACGDWTRVLGESVTVKHGVTGVFLDPPYSAEEHDVAYSVGADVAGAVREWAVANGENPQLRIALCGYEGEHEMPDSWQCLAWKARGGYGSQGEGRGRANAGRERIWFSPACLRDGVHSGPLFAEAAQ